MDSSEHEKEKIERLRRAMYSRTLSEKLGEKERHELETPQYEVSEDFVHPEEKLSGTVLPPRTLSAVRTALWWALGAAVIFFVGALGFFAYYFLISGNTSTASQNIDIAVSGPPQIQGGAPSEFQMIVTNRNNAPLELAELVITYPSGTRAVSSQVPLDNCSSVDADPSTGTLRSQRICLGTIDAGGSRQGTVPAILSGKEGDHATIKVELEYHLSGSSALFVASTDYNVVFASSPLSIAVDGNTQTTSGQPVQITVDVTSNATAPMHDVLLTAQYPFGFTFTSATPAVNQNGFWQLGDFAPGQKKTILIQGSLSGTQGDARVFHFNAGTRSSATSTILDNSFAEQPFTMTISQPFLGLTLVANGASSNAIVAPGSTVNVTVNWQNNLPTALSKAVIVARLTGLQIDGATVRSSNGFYRSSDGVVLWDKSTDPELASIAPGAHGVASFSFQMPSSDLLSHITNPYLDITVNAAGDRVSETGVPETLRAAAVERISLASDLQVLAQGLYYSSPFGSTGPMPPKAGVETTYAVVFTVTNTTNKITDATLTATLPPYVRWTGHWSPASIPLSDITFDQYNSTVTWHIGDIAPGVGLNGSTPIRLALELGLTPSESQIGQQPPLIRSVTLTGTDDATGASVTRSATPDLTTNLIQLARSGSGISVATDPGFTAANATVVR